MNNIKKNRTGLRLLGSVRGANYRRFTMNKTQQNQPVYKNIEPRCPGKQGKKGCQDCAGSNTLVGCKTCMGCTYSFDVSSNAFLGAYPTYGSFININPIVDSSSNPPCEWQYNGIVEGFSLDIADPSCSHVSISIEDFRCVNANTITGVYFYPPVGASTGAYTGTYTDCCGNTIPSDYQFDSTTIPPRETYFATNAKRMGAPYRNPIAGWRKRLDCCEKPCKVFYSTPNTPIPTGGITQSTIIVGGRFTDIDDCGGTITNYTTTTGDLQSGFIANITVELDNCCCVPDGDTALIRQPSGDQLGTPQFQREEFITGQTSGQLDSQLTQYIKTTIQERKPMIEP